MARHKILRTSICPRTGEPWLERNGRRDGTSRMRHGIEIGARTGSTRDNDDYCVIIPTLRSVVRAKLASACGLRMHKQTAPPPTPQRKHTRPSKGPYIGNYFYRMMHPWPIGC